MGSKKQEASEETKGVQYRYALDEQGHIVDIADALKGCRYTCLNPECRVQMIAKKGNQRAKHFAHKVQVDKDLCSSSGESYLHYLAKTKFAEWFNSSEQVFLSIEHKERAYCERREFCPFYREEECSRCKEVRYEHNLKRYYKEALIERGIGGGFRADVLLIPYERYKGNEIMIEFDASHQCEDKKINSNIRIVEFKIDNEEDIERIIGSPIVAEEGKVKYYNFRPKELLAELGIPPESLYVMLDVGIYDLETKTIRRSPYKDILCYKVANVRQEKNIRFFAHSYLVETKLSCIGRMKGLTKTLCTVAKYPDYKACDVCKFKAKYDDVCKLYIRAGLNRCCRDNDPYKCGHFALDRALLTSRLEQIRAYSRNHLLLIETSDNPPRRLTLEEFLAEQ